MLSDAVIVCDDGNDVVSWLGEGDIVCEEELEKLRDIDSIELSDCVTEGGA